MIEAEFLFEVGAMIKKKRIQRKMSRETLGKLVGVHRNSIWRWEDGDTTIPLWYFLQVCYALSISHFMMLPNVPLCAESTSTAILAHQKLPPKKSVQERDPPLTSRAIARHMMQRG